MLLIIEYAFVYVNFNDPVRLNVKGLYSARHGRRSSSEDEDEDKVEAVPSRSGFSSNFPKVSKVSRKMTLIVCTSV